MQRSLAVAVSSFSALGDAARHLEAMNLDRVWATELRSRDALMRAMHMAACTSRIAVGTGIAYAFTRHPVAMAAAAVEGQAACGGRLVVGIGAGTPHTRGEFGIDFDHPAARLGEYTELIRAALRAKGGLEFHGRFYDVSMPGFRFGHDDSVPGSVRIYGAALNSHALTVLAKSCDGIALHPFGHWPDYLDDVVLPAVAEGAAASGRPDLAAWCIACAMEDADRARGLAKAQIALYAAQPGFTAFLDRTPWGAVGARLREEARLGSGVRPWLSLGGRLVPDEMLDGLAIAGTPEDVAKRIAVKEHELAARGVAELTLQIPGVALPDEQALSMISELGLAAKR